MVKGGLADKQVYHNVVEGKGEIKSCWVVPTAPSTIHGRNRTSYRGISNDRINAIAKNLPQKKLVMHYPMHSTGLKMPLTT